MGFLLYVLFQPSGGEAAPTGYGDPYGGSTGGGYGYQTSRAVSNL